MHDKKQIGKIIRQKRKELGMSVVKLSLMAFVSRGHLNNIESGLRGMSKGTKESICKVLGLNI